MKTKCKLKVTQCRTFVNFSVFGRVTKTNINNMVTAVSVRFFLLTRIFLTIWLVNVPTAKRT